MKRVYVEKKPEYALKAKHLKEELKRHLGIEGIENVRILSRYDIENISDKTYKESLNTVFCEPPLDECYEMEFPYNDKLEDLINKKYTKRSPHSAKWKYKKCRQA